MTDRRRTPANTRVALDTLRGTARDVAFVPGIPGRIVSPVVDLCAAPGGPRDRQLIFGEAITLIEARNGYNFVQAQKDGYVGYVPDAALGPDRTATHWITAPATHLYTAPDFKSTDRISLSFGSHLQVIAQKNRFLQTPDGYVPTQHGAPLETTLHDPAEGAALLIGTPYLWGGNSRFGIDCSGLVQAACLACGIPCPGDSDMQAAELGTPLPRDTAPRRNDLLFWKGHVALMVDDATLIHANVHHMAVAYEPVRDAVSRIKSQGDGPVTGHRRLSAT